MLSHQRNVGAVKRCNYRNMNALVLQNLAGHVGRVGVGNGVVHVEQVELFALHHLDHHAGQRQLIGLVLKQRVVLNLNLVKVQVGLQLVKTRRHGVANHVDAVALLREVGRELGCEHARTAEGGVANDSDAHQSTMFFLTLPSSS